MRFNLRPEFHVAHEKTEGKINRLNQLDDCFPFFRLYFIVLYLLTFSFKLNTFKKNQIKLIKLKQIL